MHPNQGSNAQASYVPCLGIETATLWCSGRCSNQLIQPGQGYLLIFVHSHSDMYEMMSQCNFDLHCPDDSDVKHFVLHLGHLCVLFEEMSVQTLYPFFNQIVGFFFFLVRGTLKLYELLIYFGQ